MQRITRIVEYWGVSKLSGAFLCFTDRQAAGAATRPRLMGQLE